jgi:hypothetical protein
MSKQIGSWIDEDPSFRREAVNGAFVDRPETLEIIATLNEVRRNMREKAEPTCVTIVGKAGVGKSKLLKTYGDNNLPVEIRENGCLVRTLPVLLISLRDSLSATDVSDRAMVELMGERAPQGPRVRKSLLIEQLLLRRTELFILDEAQHLLEHGAEKTRGTTRDWIKTICKETNIPVVLAGMKEINDIVNADDQLDQLTPYRFVLGHYPYNSAAEQKAYSKFLSELDACLPFDELSLLGDPDRARRLHLLSDGLLRPLCQILRNAAARAIEDRARCIRDGDLAQAFEALPAAGRCDENPFREFL